MRNIFAQDLLILGYISKHDTIGILCFIGIIVFYYGLEIYNVNLVQGLRYSDNIGQTINMKLV